MSEETWKPVPEYPGYEVSDLCGRSTARATEQ